MGKDREGGRGVHTAAAIRAAASSGCNTPEPEPKSEPESQSYIQGSRSYGYWYGVWGTGEGEGDRHRLGLRGRVRGRLLGKGYTIVGLRLGSGFGGSRALGSRVRVLGFGFQQGRTSLRHLHPTWIRRQIRRHGRRHGAPDKLAPKVALLPLKVGDAGTGCLQSRLCYGRCVLVGGRG